MRQEMEEFWDGSGISRTICKQSAAPRSRHQHHIAQFFAGRMLFLTPSEQCRGTEGLCLHVHTHTHPFNGPFGTTRVSRYRKGKTNLEWKQETVSGSGISWATCKSAPCFNTIQYNTKFVQRHVAMASDALENETVKKHRRRRTNVL